MEKQKLSGRRVRRILAAILFLVAPPLSQGEVIRIGFAGIVDSVGDQYNLFEGAIQPGY